MKKAIQIQPSQLILFNEMDYQGLKLKKRDKRKAKNEGKLISLERMSKGKALHISYFIAQILGTAAV
jgi:hypothetical protein